MTQHSSTALVGEALQNQLSHFQKMKKGGGPSMLEIAEQQANLHLAYKWYRRCFAESKRTGGWSEGVPSFYAGINAATVAAALDSVEEAEARAIAIDVLSICVGLLATHASSQRGNELFSANSGYRV
jgi:hypothetical protein